MSKHLFTNIFFFQIITLWEGFWGIVIFGVEIENIGNELEIDSDLQVGY